MISRLKTALTVHKHPMVHKHPTVLIHRYSTGPPPQTPGNPQTPYGPHTPIGQPPQTPVNPQTPNTPMPDTLDTEDSVAVDSTEGDGISAKKKHKLPTVQEMKKVTDPLYKPATVKCPVECDIINGRVSYYV